LLTAASPASRYWMDVQNVTFHHSSDFDCLHYLSPLLYIVCEAQSRWVVVNESTDDFELESRHECIQEMCSPKLHTWVRIFTLSFFDQFNWRWWPRHGRGNRIECRWWDFQPFFIILCAFTVDGWLPCVRWIQSVNIHILVTKYKIYDFSSFCEAKMSLFDDARIHSNEAIVKTRSLRKKQNTEWKKWPTIACFFDRRSWLRRRMWMQQVNTQTRFDSNHKKNQVERMKTHAKRSKEILVSEILKSMILFSF
jgi:hypothetical protein